MNISANTEIKGLEKTGCTIGHIQHCLNARDNIKALYYTYCGKHVQRGTVIFDTKNGELTAEFTSRDNWLTKLYIL